LLKLPGCKKSFSADAIAVFSFLKNAEDGANADIDIDVARAI
jgi:hypothetical protein